MWPQRRRIEAPEANHAVQLLELLENVEFAATPILSYLTLPDLTCRPRLECCATTTTPLEMCSIPIVSFAFPRPTLLLLVVVRRRSFRGCKSV